MTSNVWFKVMFYILGVFIVGIIGLNFRSHRLVHFPFVDPFIRLNDKDYSSINDACIELSSKKLGKCYLKGNDKVVPVIIRNLKAKTVYYDGDNYIDMVFGSDREGVGIVWRRRILINGDITYSISKLQNGKPVELFASRVQNSRPTTLQ